MEKLNSCIPTFLQSTLSLSLVLAVGEGVAPIIITNGCVLSLTAKLKDNFTLNPGGHFSQIARSSDASLLPVFDEDKVLDRVSELGSLACAK